MLTSAPTETVPDYGIAAYTSDVAETPIPTEHHREGVPDQTKTTAEDNPPCPECGTIIDVRKNVLSEDEHTFVLSCPDCEFSLETESNLAARDRHKRIGESPSRPLTTDELTEAVEEAKTILYEADESISLTTFLNRSSLHSRAEAKQALRYLIDRGLVTTTPGFEYRASTTLRDQYDED